jgi:hypothetical protein
MGVFLLLKINQRLSDILSFPPAEGGTVEMKLSIGADSLWGLRMKYFKLGRETTINAVLNSAEQNIS